MKCYYEVLDISRDAEDAEIKTAYRKLALKWHPDKNIEKPEEAKEQFQLVQQAYEVLSDRQERAWYDNHREQILRGSNKDYTDDSLDVYQYFTTQCFKGYGDDKNGFYSVYRTVFEKLSQEDIEHMDSKSDYDEIPTFGNSTSAYDEEVGPFYSYWSSYSTRKSYVWLDPYNINEARNNREVKLVEKENRKVRLKAKKERNEEIRNLVAFVRKRDKRVQANIKRLEAKVVENRLKQEQLRKQKILENKKALEETNQAQWSNFDNVQKQLEEIEKNLAAEFGEDISDSNSEISDTEDNDLYCVVCNKVFKTSKAFENHESSKKHKENAELLKQAMLDEENIDNENCSDISDELVNELFCTICNKEYKTIKAFKNHETSQKHLQNLEDQNDVSENNEPSNKSKSLEDISESIEEVTNSSKKKNKKSKKVIRIQKLSTTEDEVSDLDKPRLVEFVEGDFDFPSTKKPKKKSKVKQESTKTNIQEKDSPNDSKNTTPNENINNTETHFKKSLKKSQKKNVINIVNSVNLDEIDISHCCVSCKSSFSSKNKLFDHLKKTGHSTALPEKVTKNTKRVK